MAVPKWMVAALALVSPALTFTPEQLISAPRRGEAVPNPKGNVAVFPLSQYSFKEHKTVRREWNLLDLKSGDIKLLTNDASVSEIVWLGDGTSILYVNGTNSDVAGGVELWVSDTKNFGQRYKAASISGPLSGFKVAASKKGDISFVGYGQSTANGKLYNPEQAEKPLSTARIYDSIYVRHWDYYLTPEFQAVFSGTLKKNSGKYSFDGKLNNLVSPIKYAESPIPPFGGSGDYDLSPDGQTVAFLSKAPELPKSNYTTSYVFVGPHDGSSVAKPINSANGPRTPKGVKGASSAPVFSPDGKSIAYFQMAEEIYESDKRILYVADLNSNRPIRAVAPKWDRSPDTVKWTADGRTFIISSESDAVYSLFTLPSNGNDRTIPSKIKHDGSVSAFHILGNTESALVTGTAVWSNALYSIAKLDASPKKLFYANEHDAEFKGLGPNDVEHLWSPGHRTTIHSLVVKPTGFDKKKKYPLAFLIHGGPQGSWANSWSSRWNPKVWADQGYVVVAPNPTGSTGFGQALTDAIQADWGGAPLKDLIKVWEFLRDHVDYIDTDNGVAAGASYGGFMVNWIQGDDFGRKFKAFVSHDGTFVGPAKISTEELWFINRDFNGSFWDARETYDRWDCSAPERIEKFATPQLVIHNDLDYRLSVAEGLGLFNVLQSRGVPSRFLNFPDENHWVLKQENSLVWHQQALGWINKYSGVGKTNPKAIKLEDTIVPVVDIDAGAN
ncbi:putative dipeptidyl-peptidase 5 [Myotisia sp. PD_48]|nr:putative dipeptidyl-peptidase 5 [Myotisia sp. PD_48]